MKAVKNEILYSKVSLLDFSCLMELVCFQVTIAYSNTDLFY